MPEGGVAKVTPETCCQRGGRGYVEAGIARGVRVGSVDSKAVTFHRARGCVREVVELRKCLL